MAHQPKRRLGFYFTEDEEPDDVLRIPKRSDGPRLEVRLRLSVSTTINLARALRSASKMLASSMEMSPSQARGGLSNMEDILKFPIELTHAYLYAHLLPNSLALRLNVLRRLLEILKDRPTLLRKLQTEEKDERPSLPRLRNSFMYQVPHANGSGEVGDKYTIQLNASLAALAALLRPPMKRSDSLPVDKLYLQRNLSALLLPLPGTEWEAQKQDAEMTEKPLSFGAKPPPLSMEPTVAQSQSVLPPHTPTVPAISNDELQLALDDTALSDDLKDVIALLNSGSVHGQTHTEIASTLHDLSLTAVDHRKKQDHLENRLLYALATPFVETQGPAFLEQPLSASAGSSSGMRPSASSAALNMLTGVGTQTPPTSGANNRPFHGVSLGKHALPQSVFTVEMESPWSLKAANDLACLMFGVLKSMIRSLTLMDLLAPQFRNFVTERLNKSSHNNSIIFAGEIVAIMRPGDQQYAWTSLWAKRRGLLVICMFDQIPSDAFDVVVLCAREDFPKQPYAVDSVTEIAGKLIRKVDTNRLKLVSDISESVAQDLTPPGNEHDVVDHFLSPDVAQSEKINQTRYYTLQLLAEDNIPCAITSYPLELHPDRYEVKLKIHTLPYIAGIFVLNLHDNHILSCNNAIAKNLFGRLSDELNNVTVDHIIPEFSSVLSAGIEASSDHFTMAPGLVLPEHFFRKYDAVLRGHQDPSSQERLFFTSRGIRGLHRDGKTIYIDVQLRVSSPDTFVLWVTYSRLSSTSSKGLSRQLSSLATLAPTRAEKKRTRSASDDEDLGTHTVNLPSQMKLFKDKELELLELSPQPELARHSSVRRPKANTFAIPLSHINTALEESILINRFRKPPENEPAHLPPETATSTPDTMATSVLDGNVFSYKKYLEEDILRMENEMLEAKVAALSQWPTKIGAKKRTKSFSEFTVVKDMGEGAYGKVVLAQHKEDHVYKIIIKCIDKERILVDTWVRDRVLGTIPLEIQIMAFLNNEPHPNIMRIIDYFEDPKYYYLETPIFGDPPAIDLFDYIEIKKDLSELECQFIFKQVALSVYHLHKHGIVHRDIKDENVIVDEHGVIKLIDFGSAAYLRLGPFDVFVGTIDYASPEVLRGEKYAGKPQDIWALGILLYTMLYKENPFYNVDEIMEGDLRIPYVVSDNSLQLIKKILVREVDLRPSITDIVEDAWLDI